MSSRSLEKERWEGTKRTNLRDDVPNGKRVDREGKLDASSRSGIEVDSLETSEDSRLVGKAVRKIQDLFVEK